MSDAISYEPNQPNQPTAAPGGRRRRGPGLQEAGLIAVVLVMGLIFSAYGYHDALPGRPNTFLNVKNLVEGVALPMSVFAIMAVGMTCVIVAGGIDISVASIMTLSGLVTADVLSRPLAGASAPVAFVVSVLLPLAVGLACGLVNGALVTGLRMHPFIVTLATMSIFRSACNVLFDVKTLPRQRTEIPHGSATHLIGSLIGADPAKPGTGLQAWPLIVMLVVLALGFVYLRLTIWGRENYAVGGNEEAARFSGIPVGRVKLRVYAISGTLAGLAGLVSLGRFGTVSTNSNMGYELSVVAAAVVGGASLNGGRGTAIGAILGALILALIENGIYTLHLNPEYRDMIVGLAIIIAVALDQIFGIWRKRRAARGALA